MTDETGSGQDSAGIRENLRQGIGMLSAFKEAIEESIAEARDRGDLSQERAREIMKKAVDKAQTAAEEARERFDFVSQRDFDELVRRVEVVERRLGMALEPKPGSGGADSSEPNEDSEAAADGSDEPRA